MHNFLKTVSTQAITSYLEAQGLPVPTAPEAASALALKVGAGRSQGEFAAFVINLTGGSVSAPDLQACLAERFPSAKVGDRHGSHYLCLARTGKLEGTTIAPPKAAARPRQARPDESTALRVEIEQLKAMLEAAAAQAIASKKA